MQNWAKVTNDTIIDFTVSKFNETVKSPLAAAIEAVNDIVANYPPPYNILSSGGIDSQAMVYAWKMSKHPFTVYSFRYNTYFNYHDIKTLPLFCEQEGIPYKFIDVDYFQFLDNEYDSIARQYKCSSPQISFYIKMASFFEGTCVYSGNFLALNRATLSYAIMGLYRFSLTKEGKNIIPYFFLHTPELAYSFNYFLQDKTLSTNKYPGKLEIYRTAGFPVVDAGAKYSGFEKFKDHYDSYSHVLSDTKNRLRFSGKASHRPFDWIFRYPYEELFGEPNLSFIMNKPPYVIN